MNKKIYVLTAAVVLVTSVLTAACEVDKIEPPSSSASSRLLVSVAIQPGAPSMAPGTTLQLEAVGIFSNNTVRELRQDVTWGSADPGVATVTDTGLVQAQSAGSTIITAASGTITDSALLTVSPAASLAVTPADPSIAPGTSRQLRASAVLQNASVQDLSRFADWASSDAGIAQVSGTGFVTAATATTGNAVITASFGGVSGSALLTSAAVVAVSVSPSNVSALLGKTVQFTATGTLSNSDTQDITDFSQWSASPSGIVVLTSSGLALSADRGTALVTATFGEVSGSAVMTAEEPSVRSVSIEPSSQTLQAGTSQQLAAFATLSDGTERDITADVLWTSSDPAIAAVSNLPGKEGLVEALLPGTARITASFGGTLSAQAVVTVTAGAVTGPVSILIAPSRPVLLPGDTLQFAVTAVFADGSLQENFILTGTWTSSNPAVAFVAQGFTTALTPGLTTITFTSGNLSAATALSVSAFP